MSVFVRSFVGWLLGRGSCLQVTATRSRLKSRPSVSVDGQLSLLPWPFFQVTIE